MTVCKELEMCCDKIIELEIENEKLKEEVINLKRQLEYWRNIGNKYIQTK